MWLSIWWFISHLGRCEKMSKKWTNFDSWGQFHQRSTRSFYIHKLRTQLFCAYVLGFYSTGARLLAQKLRVECWWNWPLVSILPNFIHCKMNTFLFFYYYAWSFYSRCIIFLWYQHLSLTAKIRNKEKHSLVGLAFVNVT